MAGFIGQMMPERHVEMDAAIFLHAGRMADLFAYEEEFTSG